MFAQVYYVVRSRQDGNYLTARLNQGSDQAQAHYLLLFKEHFEALSYLNTHAGEVSDRFAVESLPGSQLVGLIKRWSFDGIGIVQDPLLPRVEFLSSLS